MRGDDVVLMLTSVGTEEQALDIAHALVRLHFAACVNMIPSVRSIYRWKGKLCDDSEYLLIIKTLAREYPNVSAAVREINSYELPEILSFFLRDADTRFCEWILAATEKPKPRAARKSARPAKPSAVAGSKRRKRAAEVGD